MADGDVGHRRRTSSDLFVLLSNSFALCLAKKKSVRRKDRTVVHALVEERMEGRLDLISAKVEPTNEFGGLVIAEKDTTVRVHRKPRLASTVGTNVDATTKRAKTTQFGLFMVRGADRVGSVLTIGMGATIM